MSRRLTNQFKHRITIQAQVGEQNENGFSSQEWQDRHHLWAAIKTLRGREYHEAATTQNENTVRFVVRYTAGITSDMRIQYKDRTFEIVSVINDDERNVTMTIVAKEVM
ncbi:SPP1 family predicted phage head-tail adaptor [Anoxybacillus mongoliensis]|uniref:SPP1 family predicted phage head-tail adaptor n=1 Tax=Anoxybacillus mongoliensis TaxID=452565 RepID=A0A7W8JH63_9BACL|nr:phage head closure protein [Anoxybacillus mongoliensis]MBB5356650.1 SPP1 family predicted phage head-tail adaptor [Anoxybacillus mongoliensis]